MDQKIFIATEDQLRELISDAVHSAISNAPVDGRPTKGRYFSTIEAAAFIKKSANALRQIVHKGEIASIKRGNNLLFFEDDLVTWIEKGRRAIDDENVDPGTYLK